MSGEHTEAPAPAIMTEYELRQWLRSIGQTRVRLHRSLDRPQYIVGLGSDIWTVQALITGGFTVAPYRGGA
jgi:hypothetical protein